MTDATSLKNVAGEVAAHLRSKGIEVVVVGGSTITVHVSEVYTSHDIDFAVPGGQSLKHITASLAEIGWTRRTRVRFAGFVSGSKQFMMRRILEGMPNGAGSLFRRCILRFFF